MTSPFLKEGTHTGIKMATIKTLSSLLHICYKCYGQQIDDDKSSICIAKPSTEVTASS